MQSTPGVPSTLPLVSNATASSPSQQALPVPGSAYVPAPLATLGFTAIAPPGQTLVQPLIAGQSRGKNNPKILGCFFVLFLIQHFCILNTSYCVGHIWPSE